MNPVGTLPNRLNGNGFTYARLEHLEPILSQIGKQTMENDAINAAGSGTQIASQQDGTNDQQTSPEQQKVMASIFSNMLMRFMNAANENANNG